MENISVLMKHVQVGLREAKKEQNVLTFILATTEVLEDNYNRKTHKPKSVKDLQRMKREQLSCQRMKNNLEKELKNLEFTVKYFETTLKGNDYLRIAW